MRFTTISRIVVMLMATIAVAACGSDSGTTQTSADVASGASKHDTPTAEALIAKFKKAGIPVGKTMVYTAVTDNNHMLGKPGQYYAKVNWIDKRTKSGSGFFDTADGGSLEMFRTSSDARKRYDYVTTALKGNTVLAENDIRYGPVFLRLSSDLTAAQVKRYREIVKTAVG